MEKNKSNIATIADGNTPHIGENGNWWIGTEDTGIKVSGREAEYVTPEMFGAVGDGVADDTAAVQSALSTGKPVFLTKTYKVTELNCAGLRKVVMYGKEDVTARLSTFPVANDTYNIIFEGAVLFKNAPSKLFLERIRFFASNAGTLITRAISGSWIKQCNFTSFGGTFMGGMNGLCQISENVFFQMTGPLATSCVDCYFSNNYINSDLASRVTLFSGTNFCGMHFIDNFVDYCKIAFGKYKNWEFNLIQNNFFDSIFRVFKTEIMFNSTSVIGNHFVRINRENPNRMSGLSAFEGEGVADEEMKSEDWRVFDISEGCSRVNISGNSGEAETALKMSNVNNPCDAVIDLSGVKGSREFSYYNTSNAEGSSIFVKDLDYINVDSLPSAALYDKSRETLTSFNKQHVICKGNLYLNNNGTWLKITNNA